MSIDEFLKHISEIDKSVIELRGLNDAYSETAQRKLAGATTKSGELEIHCELEDIATSFRIIFIRAKACLKNLSENVAKKCSNEDEQCVKEIQIDRCVHNLNASARRFHAIRQQYSEMEKRSVCAQLKMAAPSLTDEDVETIVSNKQGKITLRNIITGENAKEDVNRGNCIAQHRRLVAVNKKIIDALETICEINDFVMDGRDSIERVEFHAASSKSTTATVSEIARCVYEKISSSKSVERMAYIVVTAVISITLVYLITRVA